MAENSMNRGFFSPPVLRIILVVGGFLAIAFGFFCQSEAPGRIILAHFSHDNMLNPETINALVLAGVFSGVVGLAAAAIGLLRPAWIERASALPRAELLYGASVAGTGVMLFLGLALGIMSMRAYAKILAVVAGGGVLLFIERKSPRRIASLFSFLFSRPLAFVGYIAAGSYFFLIRFPLGTFGRFLFSRDYPMFQYTIRLDYSVLKQGYLYGWEPYFSGGYPTFLNLRSLLIPYMPFALLPPAVGFHLMIYTIYLGVPFLCYWVAKELSEDRDMAVLSGWAGVGVMTGYMWHILHWGMMPTFASIPFLMLALGFFVRAMKGSRWGVFLSALFWAPVAYIHLGHFAHVALALFILGLLYTWEEHSLRAAKTLAKITVLTILFAAPYLIEFLRYRGHVILTNMYSYPQESLLGMVGILLNTLKCFIPTLIWHYSAAFMAWQFPDYSYFAFFTIFSFVALYLALSGEKAKRKAGLLYAGAILVSALSFIPKFQLSFQRMLYMVPPLMALALGFWMGEAKKRGHILPIYILLVLLVFYTRFYTDPSKAIPALEKRGDFDPAVVEKVAELGGNYILFENTASLNPYVDLLAEYERIDDEWDVHAPGFLRIETGKRFFAHPGYNPHPYYDLRRTYIATGTFDGRNLTEYEPEHFKDLFRKWGIEYLVLWSDRSKAFFEKDGDYEKVLAGARYTIYRFRNADPRAVATEGGDGKVSYPDNFTAEVTLEGVPEGSRVILRANYFAQWRAGRDGADVPLYDHEGRIAFDAPAPDCTVHLRFPKHRGYLLAPILAAIGGVALSVRRRP